MRVIFAHLLNCGKKLFYSLCGFTVIFGENGSSFDFDKSCVLIDVAMSDGHLLGDASAKCCFASAGQTI